MRKSILTLEEINPKNSIFIFPTKSYVKENKLLLTTEIENWVHDNFIVSLDGEVWTKINVLLGKLIKYKGLYVYNLLALKGGMNFKDYFLIFSFPIKVNYLGQLDINFLFQNAEQTIKCLNFVNRNKFQTIYIPLFKTANNLPYPYSLKLLLAWFLKHSKLLGFRPFFYLY